MRGLHEGSTIYNPAFWDDLHQVQHAQVAAEAYSSCTVLARAIIEVH